MDKATFVHRDSWLGSCYELAIPLYHGEPDNPTPLRQVARVLWGGPGLRGPWLNKDDFPDPAKIADPLQYPVGYGLLTLPEGQTLGCLTAVVEESDCDRLYLCFPMGMLEAVFPVEYDLWFSTNPWLEDVNHALVCLAEAIYREIPFDLGIIGEELSGYTDRTDRKSFQVEYLEQGGFLLSPQFCQQIGRASAGKPLSSGLRWFPFREPRVPQF